ncbi:unnamed protein product [Ixodes persulcatus]
MACVRLTSRCGCPLDNPVLVRGGHGGLRCAPSRALWQPCGWHEQCAAVDPGLVCKAGFCRCLRGGSKLCAIHQTNNTNTWLWAGCLGAAAVCGAMVLLCVAHMPSRTKVASNLEACLLVDSTVSMLPNPAAQRLLFSRRKPACTDRLSPTILEKVLPRGFLSCHGLPEPCHGSSTQSCASRPEPHWSCPLSPPESDSLELQVIELDKLGILPTASVHQARRASAPALPGTGEKPPDRSPESRSSPALRSESGEPAADAVSEWASKLTMNEYVSSYGFSVDASSSRPSGSGFLAVREKSSRQCRQAQMRRRISESLRRELADAWKCGESALPVARLVPVPHVPAFLSFEPSSEPNGGRDPA